MSTRTESGRWRAASGRYSCLASGDPMNARITGLAAEIGFRMRVEHRPSRTATRIFHAHRPELLREAP